MNEIQKRRNKELYSAILLAGGQSKRMGTNKAEIKIDGKTFTEIQYEKLKNIGIQDIIISGYGKNMIPDCIPNCGPIGGLYTCLQLAEHENCLVIPVDVPLVTEEILQDLLEFHQRHSKPITIVEHHEKLEFLIGVYNRSVVTFMKEQIDHGWYAIKKILSKEGFEVLKYTGDEKALMNCNTIEELKKI